MKRRWPKLLIATLLLVTMVMPMSAMNNSAKTPVLLDTDIGSDVDDTFALAMLLASPQIDLKAVTTVTGDTAARARIVAKMLAVAKRNGVPVAAGPPTRGDPFAQARWAEGFSSPSLTKEDAVELMHREIRASQGAIVLIALGPLGNVAALMKRHADDAHAIKEIVLMGGSILRGYKPGSGPEPEYNIATDPEAAQFVFGAGIPLLVAPLDVTADLQLKAPERAALFAKRTPLMQAVRELYLLWGQPTPTLYDPMAVALLLHPGISQMQPMHIRVEPNGVTRAEANTTPNAQVAMKVDPSTFIRYYLSCFR